MGFGLLMVSAAMHLLTGIFELRRLLVGDGLIWYLVLMVVAAMIPLALMAGAVSYRLSPGPTYLVIAALMVIYLLAYADVHGYGYLEATTGLDVHTHEHHSHEPHGHDHHTHHDHHDHGHHDETAAFETVVDHLMDDMIALLSKVSEWVAAIVFTGLAIRDW